MHQSQKQFQHWLIVGPGALGQLYAGKLAQAGHSLSLWGRNGLFPHQKHSIIDLSGATYTWHNQGTLQPIDAVLVTTKIYQSDDATQAVLTSGLITANCPIILMHNGLGAGQHLKRLCQEQPLLLASSRHGALKETDTNIRHTGQGMTQLGLVQGNLSSALQISLCETLNQAIGEVIWHENILIPLWQKLVINSVINPLTARDRVANGQLLAPSYQPEIEALCQQACWVANHCGIPLVAEDLLAQIQRVLKATALNTSSMLQDVLQHRQTEIDYINGYLIQRAKEHQILVPHHEQVLAAVQTAQIG